MKTFKDLAFVYEGLCGDKVWSRSYMIFDNGYGVSVVQGPHSYGGQKGLYELAVLGTDGFITYETPVTNDATISDIPGEITFNIEERMTYGDTLIFALGYVDIRLYFRQADTESDIFEYTNALKIIA